MMPLNRRRFLQAMAGLLPAILPVTRSPLASSGYHTGVIPSSGERIPAIGLGSWLVFSIDTGNEDELAQREDVIRSFLEHGGGLIDSSPMYGVAEEVIGLCLQRIQNRERLFAATKVWTHGNRQALLQMEESRRLWNIQNFDLMQVHNLMDWKTHIPTLQAMKESNDIRYLGVTTSHGRRHDELLKIIRTNELDFVQFTYNILDREAENRLLPMAADKGLAVIINRPFQRGGLFSKFSREPLPVWAQEIGCDNWAQFFLKFIISHPDVTCTIPATSRVDHLLQNMGAGHGPLPDEKLRNRMIRYIQSL